MKFTEEIVHQIWDDKTGERVEVGPDADSIGLIEIRQVDSTGKIVERITINPEIAEMVARAINGCKRELAEASKE